MEDFRYLQDRVLPFLTVNQLKLCIRGLNDRLNAGVKVSGNKPELTARISKFLKEKVDEGNERSFGVARDVIYSSGGQRPIRASAASLSGTASPPSTPPIVPRVRLTITPNGSASGSPQVGSGSASPHNIAIAAAHSSSSSSHPHPHHPHHHGHHSHARSSSSSSSSSSTSWWDRVKYKSSPFYDELEKVVPPRMCPEARESRNSVPFDITLSDDQLAKLRSSRDAPEGGTRYQLRFFCCWAETPSSYPSGSPGTLIEYPQICELKVNGNLLSANLRGLKNKPGTVNPPDITPLCRLDRNVNKVEFVYANTTKRYLAAIQIVKCNPVDSIVEKIKKNKFVTSDEVLKKIRQRNEDSEIEVGSSMVSLKCPLGHMRINLPCRSSFCNHIQCFDVYTFFHMNEQTPTWTCPVCSRVMKSWDEIVVDGYFSNMLKCAPRDQESVVIESNGEWRFPKPAAAITASSPSSLSKHGRAPQIKNDTPRKSEETSEVMLIDEDEDEGGRKETDDEERSKSVAESIGGKKGAEVIDLTLSEDDEDDEDDDEDDDSPAARPDTDSRDQRAQSEDVLPVKLEEPTDRDIRTPPRQDPAAGAASPLSHMRSPVHGTPKRTLPEDADRQGYADRRLPRIRVESMDPESMDPEDIIRARSSSSARGSAEYEVDGSRQDMQFSELAEQWGERRDRYAGGYPNNYTAANKRKRSMSIEDEAADSHSAAASALLGLNQHRHHHHHHHPHHPHQHHPRSMYPDSQAHTPGSSPGPAFSSLTLNDDHVSPLSNTSSSHSASPPLSISLPPFPSSSWNYRSSPVASGSRSSSPYRTPVPPLPPINTTSSQPLSRGPSWSSSLPPLKTATTGIEDDFSPTLAPLAMAISGVEGEGRRETGFSRFPDYANIRPYEGERIAEQGRTEPVNGRHKSRGMSLSHILSGGNGKRAEDERYDIDGERGYGDGSDVIMANDDAPESSRFESLAQTSIAQARWRDEANQSLLSATTDGEHSISSFSAIDSTGRLTQPPRATGSDDARIASMLVPPSSFTTRSGSGSDNREGAIHLFRDEETMSETESDAENYMTAPESFSAQSEKGNGNTRLAYSGSGSFRAAPRLEERFDDREPVLPARLGTDDDDDEGDEAMNPSDDRRDPSGKGHGVGGGDRRRGGGGDDTGRGQTWATQVVAR